MNFKNFIHVNLYPLCFVCLFKYWGLCPSTLRVLSDALLLSFSPTPFSFSFQDRILLCSAHWPGICYAGKESTCLCLSSAGTKGMHCHCLAHKLFLLVSCKQTQLIWWRQQSVFLEDPTLWPSPPPLPHAHIQNKAIHNLPLTSIAQVTLTAVYSVWT